MDLREVRVRVEALADLEALAALVLVADDARLLEFAASAAPPSSPAARRPGPTLALTGRGARAHGTRPRADRRRRVRRAERRRAAAPARAPTARPRESRAVRSGAAAERQRRRPPTRAAAAAAAHAAPAEAAAAAWPPRVPSARPPRRRRVVAPRRSRTRPARPQPTALTVQQRGRCARHLSRGWRLAQISERTQYLDLAGPCLSTLRVVSASARDGRDPPLAARERAESTTAGARPRLARFASPRGLSRGQRATIAALGAPGHGSAGLAAGAGRGAAAAATASLTLAAPNASSIVRLRMTARVRLTTSGGAARARPTAVALCARRRPARASPRSGPSARRSSEQRVRARLELYRLRPATEYVVKVFLLDGGDAGGGGDDDGGGASCDLAAEATLTTAATGIPRFDDAPLATVEGETPRGRCLLAYYAQTLNEEASRSGLARHRPGGLGRVAVPDPEPRRVGLPARARGWRGRALGGRRERGRVRQRAGRGRRLAHRVKLELPTGGASLATRSCSRSAPTAACATSTCRAARAANELQHAEPRAHDRREPRPQRARRRTRVRTRT